MVEARTRLLNTKLNQKLHNIESWHGASWSIYFSKVGSKLCFMELPSVCLVGFNGVLPLGAGWLGGWACNRFRTTDIEPDGVLDVVSQGSRADLRHNTLAPDTDTIGEF